MYVTKKQKQEKKKENIIILFIVNMVIFLLYIFLGNAGSVTYGTETEFLFSWMVENTTGFVECQTEHASLLMGTCQKGGSMAENISPRCK
jgi:hypothetical protein